MIDVIGQIKLGVRPKPYLTEGIIQPLHRRSTGAGSPWLANMIDNSIRVFSSEDVDKARDGRKIYGFKRYLQWILNGFPIKRK